MAWVRIDDHYSEHPKFAKCGPLGVSLWLAALAYSNRNLTDGFIPWSIARTLVDWKFLGMDDEKHSEKGHVIYTIGATCGMSGEDVDCDFVIALLVSSGLWEEVDRGYHIHDYDKYQLSKQDILDIRVQKQAAGQAGGLASAKARAEADSKRRLKQNPTPNPNPNPNPNPVPKPKNKEGANGSRTHHSLARFSRFWEQYPKKVTKQECLDWWKKQDPDDVLFEKIMAGLERYKGTSTVAGGFTLDPIRFLKHRRWEDEEAPGRPDYDTEALVKSITEDRKRRGVELP